MKHNWLKDGVILGIGLIIAFASVRRGQTQDSAAAKPSSEAAHIAALEEKISAMEERLAILERRLGEENTALVASHAAVPAAAAKTAAAPLNPSMAASAPITSTPAVALQAPARAQVEAGSEGFFLRSPEGDFSLRLRYQVNVDGRFTINRNAAADPNTIYLRRTEPILEGTLYRRFDYQVLTDFSKGKPRVNNAYIVATIVPAFNIEVGKFKLPLGLERLRSGMMLPLMERALPSQLFPARDIGVQLFGDLAHSRLSYAVGVFNGVPDGSNSDGNPDDHMEFNGRLMAQPFLASSLTGLAGLAIGVSGSYGDAQGTLVSPNLGAYSSTGTREFFHFRSDGTSLGTVVADGVHYRLSPQGYYYVGPFGVMAEYVQSVEEVRRGTTRGTMNNRSWQVMTSYVLTGENGSFDGVEPAKPFDPEQGNWGAFEVAARYTALKPDGEAFPLFADPDQAAREAEAWAVGLNWYLNRNLKLVLGYEQTKFESAVPNITFDTEKLFQQRFQLRF